MIGVGSGRALTKLRQKHLLPPEGRKEVKKAGKF